MPCRVPAGKRVSQLLMRERPISGPDPAARHGTGGARLRGLRLYARGRGSRFQRRSDKGWPVPELERGPLIDTSRPHITRVYDYWLGGKDNFAADREAGEALLDPGKGHPGLRKLAQQNRRFVIKAVRWTVAVKGIAQVIDLGCGLPATPSVHDSARSADPAARVVYVDKDPLVFAHVAALARGEGLAAIKADVTEPDRVLRLVADLEVRPAGALIDLSQPACLVLGGTLSAMDADTARATVAGYAEALAPGSAVIVSCASFADEGVAARIAEVLGGGWRSHPAEAVASFFEAGGLRVFAGRVADIRCWPMMREEEPAAAIIGGVGVLD